MIRRKEDETPHKAGPDITDRSGSVDEADDHTGVTPFAAAAFLADPLLSLSVTALWVGRVKEIFVVDIPQAGR